MSGTSPTAATAALASAATIAQPIPVAAPAAHAEASNHKEKLTGLLTSTIVHPGGPGAARWEHATAIALVPTKRAAMAWLAADAIMESRAGESGAHAVWRQAALAGTKVSADERGLLIAFIEDVFGVPGQPEKSLDHLVGHVGEWLWYLHANELVASDRDLIYLETPKFTVVDSGGDGFAMYRPTATGDTFYRLWEMKKQTGGGHPSSATGTAYTQLTEHGHRYLARLTAPLSMIGGDVQALAKDLVNLWLTGSHRAGVGVSIVSDMVPPPSRCFSTMGTRFPQFPNAGQLEGLLVTVEDLVEVAATVREYLWTAL